MRKTWNIRDKPEEDIRLEAERLYKQIDAEYKMIEYKMKKKVSRAAQKGVHK
jgi:hypothetical protein